MTTDLGQQERAVLDAIAANPFVGQQEIADALGLARSTVAAHVAALVQKGYVLGRGYVLPRARRILCIGGAVLDRKYASPVPVVPATSNPVSGCRSFGGVARNVAETLARLGAATGLVSAVGDDEAGRAILDHLRAAGVDVSGCVALRGERTAEYVAVLGPDNDLVLGLADMAIFDRLDPAELDRAWPQVAAAAWVFFDCNLPSRTIAGLVSRRPSGRFRLAANAVSTPKAARLPPSLAGIDLLFVNLDEARAIAGAPLEAEAAAAALVAKGAGAAVLTRGAAGAVLATPDGVTTIAGVPAVPVDVTGAGDALVAATLARLAAGDDLAAAVAVGVRLAARTTESAFTVLPDLSPRWLDAAAPAPAPTEVSP